MIVGCYSLNLYCDRKNEEHEYKEFPHTYTDELGSRCRKSARQDGWLLKRNGDCICPKCACKGAKK